MMDSLSDYDLRKTLMEHGVHAGPVTATTRNVYRKKLAKVISSSKENIVTQSYVEENYTESISTEEDQVDFKKSKKEKQKKVESSPESSFISSSPYRYAPHDFPSDDNLRRRPLYTPGGTLRTTSNICSSKTSKLLSTMTQKDHTDGTTARKTHAYGTTPRKASFPWCRLILGIVVLLVLLILLVYYHMEHNLVKELPFMNN